MDKGAKGKRRAFTATGRSYPTNSVHPMALGRSRSLTRAPEVEPVCASKGTVGRHVVGTYAATFESGRGFCEKYEPKTFDDIVGHQAVVQATFNTAQQKRAAEIYFYHGPGGTGKTSLAKVFGMALNCESVRLRPCWSCQGCRRSRYVTDMFNKSGLSGFRKISKLLKNGEFVESVQGLNLLIIEECHKLTEQAWNELQDILERRFSSLVFVLISTEMNASAPSAILSRCHKYFFPKLKDADILLKLKRIAGEEGMAVETETLRLIAAKAEGSLREAENLLQQVALLGPKIDSSMVQQLVGLASQGKLTELLELAILKDALGASKRARELIEAGVEPQDLVSQLTSFLADMISSSAMLLSGGTSSQDIHTIDQNSIATDPDKLFRVLKILVETKKQFDSSANHTMLIVTALFQIASDDLSNPAPADAVFSSCERISSVESKNRSLRKVRHSSSPAPYMDATDPNSTSESIKTRKNRGKAVQSAPQFTDMSDMGELWQNILGRIETGEVKDFLCHQRAQLLSLTVSRANAIIHLTVRAPEDQLPVVSISEDRIVRTLESALGCPVVLNMSLEPAGWNTVQKGMVSTSRHQRSGSFHSQSGSAHSKETEQHENGKVKKLIGKRGECAFKQHEVGSEVPAIRILSLQEPSEARNGPDYVDGLIKTASEGRMRDQNQMRSNRGRRRWLSLSSNLQSDASIEPYSKDILFDKVRNTAVGGTKGKARGRGEAQNPNEDSKGLALATCRGLCRSWSCKE